MDFLSVPVITHLYMNAPRRYKPKVQSTFVYSVYEVFFDKLELQTTDRYGMDDDDDGLVAKVGTSAASVLYR